MGQELVLNFHGIGVPHAGVPAAEIPYWISRPLFVDLLDRLVAARTVANPCVPIVITFDDGNITDATLALPELVKRRLAAAFFVCTGRIGACHYLDKNALRDLQQTGMEIGTHGMHHRDWRTLDSHTLDAEIVQARRTLEDLCGRPITAAAIPFGSYDRRVLNKLRGERFACVYTSDRGLARATDWLKPRETVDCTWQETEWNRWLSPPLLKARLRRRIAMIYKALR